MAFLTNEERLELLMSAVSTLMRLYQDLAHAPALTLAQNSEVKKIGRIWLLKRMNSATEYGCSRP